MSDFVCPACLAINQGGGKLITCSACKTIFKKERYVFDCYDSRYFEQRGYNIRQIGISKVETFKSFWKQLFPIKGKVLEVGCGHGFGLKAAEDLGLEAYGYDVDPSILDKMEEPEKSRISINDLARFEGKRFSAVAFFDSFEHLPNPDEFLNKIEKYVERQTKLLLVLPRADSASRYLLGKFWPFFSPDHWIHYSLKGLESLLKRNHYCLKRTFFPLKCINLEGLLRNIFITYFNKPGMIQSGLWNRINFWFSLGQMGIIAEHL